MAPTDESEWRTRKTRIDPKLDDAGWCIARGRSKPEACRSEEEETDAGPADYALWLDGRVAGVVEAKKVTTGPQNVLTQAARYARGLSPAVAAGNYDGHRCPFLYSTNGEIVWFHDVRHPLSRSRRVSGFHTPSAFRELLARDFDADCAKLLALPHDHPRLRPYQKDANAAVEKAISERKRALLVAMATGTGKTFTLVNQIYRLMKCGVARRVLFLVDRRALAAQAVRAFSGLEVEPGMKFDQAYEVYSSRFQTADFGEDEKFNPNELRNKYLTDPQPGHAFVYVCTIQRMAINLFGRQAVPGLPGSSEESIDDDADRLDIPIHAFDLIVADECHRGYTAQEESTWRSTLDHFDAIKIGLTATPAAHTIGYFTHKVFEYGYERAVRDGHLVDYDAVYVRSDVRMSGLFLREGENVEMVDPDTGLSRRDKLEDERQFDTAEIERKVTAPESNRKILEELKRYADDHERQHGRFTYLLFLKMADERGSDIPKGCDWPSIRDRSGTELTDQYIEALRKLGKTPGILGDIYAGAQSRFNNPVNLKKLVSLIDETEWTTLDVDVKAAAYEGLLEKAAAEGKKGAGQYFTPRVLIQAICRCMKPDARARPDFAICDPAVGSGGFLVCAYEWLRDQTKGALDRDVAKRVRTKTYFGADLVPRPRRMALMNLYLHGIEPHIKLGRLDRGAAVRRAL